MQEINTKTYLKNKKIKREDMEEIDIIICLNKKTQTIVKLIKAESLNLK